MYTLDAGVAIVYFYNGNSCVFVCAQPVALMMLTLVLPWLKRNKIVEAKQATVTNRSFEQ